MSDPVKLRAMTVATGSAVAALCLAVSGCSSGPSAEERSGAMSADYAYSLMMDATGFPNGYISGGSGPSKTATCLDGADQWITGCVWRDVTNPRRIDGPDGSWAYWAFDFINETGPTQADVTVKTRCYGMIPPSEQFPLQMYEVDCANPNQGLSGPIFDPTEPSEP